MKNYLLIALNFLSLQLLSQTIYNAPEGFSEVSFINLEEKGIIVSSLADKANGRTRTISYEFLDTELNSLWKTEGQVPKTPFESKRFITNNSLLTLFNDGSYLSCVSFEKGTCTVNKLSFPKMVMIDEMVGVNDIAIFRAKNRCFSFNSSTQKLEEINFKNDGKNITLRGLIEVEGQDFVFAIGYLTEKKDTECYAFKINSEGKFEYMLQLTSSEQRYVNEVSCMSDKDAGLVFSGECKYDEEDGVFIRGFKGKELSFNTFFSNEELKNSTSGNERGFRLQLHPSEFTPRGIILPIEVMNLGGGKGYSTWKYTHILVLGLDFNGEDLWIGSQKYSEPNTYGLKKKFINSYSNSDGTTSFIRGREGNNTEIYVLDRNGEFIQSVTQSLTSKLEPCPEMKKPETYYMQWYNDVFFIYTGAKGKEAVYVPRNDGVRTYCIQFVKF